MRIEQSAELRRVLRAPGYLPVLLNGEVLGEVATGHELVLTLNGRVAAVVPVNPWWTGPPRFAAVLPERLLRDGANKVEAFWTS